MLSKILSKEECAKCRLCCSFDSYDLWETPVITKNLASQILQEYLPQQEFVRRDDYFLLKMNKEPDEDLYYCSLLDHSNGCIMGDDKPFDCRIWPYRVMSLGFTRVITLSPVCPVVQTKPLEDIQALAKKLAPAIFEYADENPGAVKPYIDGYPIMVVEKPQREDNV